MTTEDKTLESGEIRGFLPRSSPARFIAQKQKVTCNFIVFKEAHLNFVIIFFLLIILLQIWPY